jgi:hypothetical protein
MRYMILALFLIAGCSSLKPKLELSGNTASNIAVVASYIPSGTDSATAFNQMSDAGFTCKIERNKTFAISKGTTPIGAVGPMDFLWCDKQQGNPVARRWQVILILDEEDKVKDHSVSTGLVGP